MSANVHCTAQTEKNRPWLRFGAAFALIFLAFLIVLALTTPLLDPMRRRLSPAADVPVAEGTFAAADERLLCAGDTALWVYSPDGTAAEYPADFSVPRFRTAGGQLLVFDADGKEFARLSDDDDAEPTLATADGTFFDAAVAGNGTYALLLDQPDCRAVLEVYDGDGALRFRHRSKTAFLNSCALSPDAALAAVTAAGQRGLEFEAALCLYRTDREDAPVTWPLESLPYACGFLSDEVLYAACNDGLYIYRTDGALLRSLSGGRLLAQADGALLAVSDGTVQLFGADGSQQAAATPEQEPRSGALNGDYLALQFDDSLRVYTHDFTLRGRTDAAEAFCLCRNGAVWCINGQTAAQFIP